jgi:hypothetical protein
VGAVLDGLHLKSKAFSGISCTPDEGNLPRKTVKASPDSASRLVLNLVESTLARSRLNLLVETVPPAPVSFFLLYFRQIRLSLHAAGVSFKARVAKS